MKIMVDAQGEKALAALIDIALKQRGLDIYRDISLIMSSVEKIKNDKEAPDVTSEAE